MVGPSFPFHFCPVVSHIYRNMEDKSSPFPPFYASERAAFHVIPFSMTGRRSGIFYSTTMSGNTQKKSSSYRTRLSVDLLNLNAHSLEREGRTINISLTVLESSWCAVSRFLWYLLPHFLVVSRRKLLVLQNKKKDVFYQLTSACFYAVCPLSFPTLFVLPAVSFRVFFFFLALFPACASEGMNNTK